MKILLFSALLFCAALVACNDETRGTDQADTTDTDDDLQWDLLPDDSGDDATADTAGDVTVDTDDEPVEEPPTDLVVDTTEDMGRDIPEDQIFEVDGEAFRYVELTPACWHAPHIVTAGGSFPIALLGQTATCVTFEHVELDVDGTDVTVRLIGLERLDGECPHCIETYIGMIYFEAPNPGGYTITIAGESRLTGATGGLIGELECQDDCPEPQLESADWTLYHFSSNELGGACGPTQTDFSLVQFSGSCHDYTLTNEDWSSPTQVKHCNDGEIYFGGGMPYSVDATVCEDATWISPQIILGINNDSADDSLFILSRR